MLLPVTVIGTSETVDIWRLLLRVDVAGSDVNAETARRLRQRIVRRMMIVFD
jgi:hypothetical protein